jgi:hypothetical protein
MVFRNFRKLCISVSVLLTATPLLCSCFVQPEHVRGTDPQTTSSIIREPVGYSSDGPNAVIRPNDPVTNVYPAPRETRKATDPATIVTRTQQ